MLAAPFAAISFESIGNIRKSFQEFKDRIYYGETLPPVGSLSLSYARFLELLAERRVKRIIIMSDGKIAMVEVTHSLTFLSDLLHPASSYKQLLPNRTHQLRYQSV